MCKRHEQVSDRRGDPGGSQSPEEMLAFISHQNDELQKPICTCIAMLSIAGTVWR